MWVLCEALALGRQDTQGEPRSQMVLSKGLVFRLVRSRAHSGCLSLRVLLSHILVQDDIPDIDQLGGSYL